MKYIYIAFIAFILNGCLYQTTNGSPVKHEADKTNFSLLTLEALKTMDNTFLKLSESNIYVTDFINLENLNNNSKLGYILSQETKVILTKRYGLNINEIEFTKHLSISSNGTKVLSRDVTKLKKSTIDDNSYIVVGNYVTTAHKLILYIKVIDMDSGKVVDTAKVSTGLSQEIALLL